MCSPSTSHGSSAVERARCRSSTCAIHRSRLDVHLHGGRSAGLEHPFEFVAEHDDSSAEAAGRDLAPVEINVDYILMLVEKYRDAKGDGTDKEVRAEIQRAVDSSPSLRNKKDLIEAFVDSLSITGRVDTEWRAFVEARRTAELDAIITDEGLNPEATSSVHRDGLPRRGDAKHRNRHHQGAARHVPLRWRRCPLGQEAIRARQAQRLR